MEENRPLFTLFKKSYNIIDNISGTEINIKYLYAGFSIINISVRLGPITKLNQDLANNIKKRISEYNSLFTEKGELKENETLLRKNDVIQREKMNIKKKKETERNIVWKARIMYYIGFSFILIGLILIIILLVLSMPIQATLCVSSMYIGIGFFAILVYYIVRTVFKAIKKNN